MNRRALLAAGLTLAIAGAFAWLGRSERHPQRARPPPPTDHVTVVCTAEGRITIEGSGAEIPPLPERRRGTLLLWDDVFSAYQAAVAARFGARSFEAGDVRTGAVLRIEAPPDTPWRTVTWLMYPAWHQDLRIPIVRLVAGGLPPLDLPIPHDPGHTDAYVMDPPHVHVRPEGLALYDRGVIAEHGVYVEPDQKHEPRFRAGPLDALTRKGLREALRAALRRSEEWAWGAVALTWGREDDLSFARMADILQQVLAPDVRVVYLEGLEPDEIHGR